MTISNFLAILQHRILINNYPPYANNYQNIITDPPKSLNLSVFIPVFIMALISMLHV